MTRLLSLIAFGLCGVLIIGCQGKGMDDEDDNEMNVSMADVPEAVRASFEKAHPGATVQQIEKETHADGTAEYEFEFMMDGKKHEVELDQNGAVSPEDKD